MATNSHALSLKAEANKVCHRILIQTPVGNLAVTASALGVTSLHFVSSEHTPNASKRKSASLTNIYLRQVREELTQYFKGKLRTFSTKLDLKGTAFQSKVWHQLLSIPYGVTMTYQQQSQQLDNEKAIRAVAQANAKNPIAIIVPCHRVIGKDGSLTGYASGKNRKEELLRLERISTNQPVQGILAL